MLSASVRNASALLNAKCSALLLEMLCSSVRNASALSSYNTIQFSQYWHIYNEFTATSCDVLKIYMSKLIYSSQHLR